MDSGTRFIVAMSGTARVVHDDEPIYVISVAAELAGMHPQTLRQYDRLGLVTPGRTGGGGRRYSLRDIAQLREVQRLSQEEGVNLAGIKRILDLENELDSMQSQLEGLVAELAAAHGAQVDYPYLPARVAPSRLAVWHPRRRSPSDASAASRIGPAFVSASPLRSSVSSSTAGSSGAGTTTGVGRAGSLSSATWPTPAFASPSISASPAGSSPARPMSSTPLPCSAAASAIRHARPSGPAGSASRQAGSRSSCTSK